MAACTRASQELLPAMTCMITDLSKPYISALEFFFLLFLRFVYLHSRHRDYKWWYSSTAAEWWTIKVFKWSGHHLTEIWSRYLHRVTEIQEYWSLGLDVNHGSAEWKARVLFTAQRSSVMPGVNIEWRPVLNTCAMLSFVILGCRTVKPYRWRWPYPPEDASRCYHPDKFSNYVHPLWLLVCMIIELSQPYISQH